MKRFKVYCKPQPGSPASGYFFWVKIMKNRKSLLRVLRKHWDPKDVEDITSGVCQGYDVFSFKKGEKRGHKTDELGCIWLSMESDFEVVSHECAHAALIWAKRAKVNPQHKGRSKGGFMPTDCGNEKFCYVLGALVDQILARVSGTVTK